MSTFRDRGVIDITLVEDGKYILVILDDMEWEFGTRQDHGHMLQAKINDYLSYIAGGQAEEAKPGLRPVIRILAQYSYSRYCLDFLERVRDFVKNKDDICDIEWTHSDNDGPFEDGFSDDYVFDIRKIYPRIKKNYSKDPLNEVSLMAPYGPSAHYPENMVMVRVMDSLIGMFVQDVGSAYTYITYDMLPEGMDVPKLQRAAFDNLAADVTYRSVRSKEEGIFGIVAGGNFEAESLCINSIWKEISEDLNDDVLICIPTKDIVFYTRANDKKLRKKLFKMAEDMFDKNRKDTPQLLFSKDVYVYKRENDSIRISEEYKY